MPDMDGSGPRSGRFSSRYYRNRQPGKRGCVLIRLIAALFAGAGWLLSVNKGKK